jgi:cell division protein FtsQ
MKRMKNIWRRLRFPLFWILVAVYSMVVLGLVADNEHLATCNRIEVVIEDSTELPFVAREDVLELLVREENRILGYPMNQLDIAGLEGSCRIHPFIRTAEVYGTVEGVLTVEIEQRDPVIRVMGRDGSTHYIDGEGYLVPDRQDQSIHLLHVTGHLQVPNTGGMAIHLDELEGSEILHELFRMAKVIHEDEFWRGQIEQIYIDENGEAELVPRVGAHLILLGQMSGFEEKLEKLYSFYMNGLGRTNWNKYEIINLKYQDQIVCTKR